MPCPILVTGATGLLGPSLVPFLRKKGHEVSAWGRSPGGKADLSVDLSDTASTRVALDDLNPSVIVHLAAQSNVDRCEENPPAAYQNNVVATENLVRWIERNPSARLVYFSTDQIYDGLDDLPQREDQARPGNIYAFSKLCAESIAARVHGTVLRTNFFGRSENPARASQSDWVVRGLQERKPITLFTDIYFSPISISSLCECVGKVITDPQPGVFNLGSRGGMNKSEFAGALARHVGLPLESARDGISASSDLIAYRPRRMAMDSRRFEEAFDLKLPSLEEEIERVARDYIL